MFTYRSATVPTEGEGVKTEKGIYVDGANKVVKESDPTVAKQVYAPGTIVPFAEAEQYGLSKTGDLRPGMEVKGAETLSGKVSAVVATGDPTHTATTGMSVDDVNAAAAQPSPGLPLDVQTQVADASTGAEVKTAKTNAAATVTENDKP